MPDSKSSNGTVPETQQPDVTQTMTLDQKIQPKTPVDLPKIDINQPVAPGADAVVNHVDGSQELATGPAARAVHEAEKADSTKLADPAKVTPVGTESPRSPDPEVNQPSQTDVAEEPAAPAEEPEEAPAPEEPEAPENPASADVKNS